LIQGRFFEGSRSFIIGLLGGLNKNLAQAFRIERLLSGEQYRFQNRL
jgi:hypothetical protein